MCGLAGIVTSSGADFARRRLDVMLRMQVHRGPDHGGAWDGSVRGSDVALGLRRLKILDLSDSANQPMCSRDDRFVLVFNGEIYNYVELREQLERDGCRFATTGDTEVLLQTLRRWGTDAFSRLNGMWALALLDRERGELLLSRDRFGVKPLYTYVDERGLWFASEIKALLAATDRKFEVNADAAAAYLRQCLLDTTNETFFRGINALPAGHFARIALGCRTAPHLSLHRYWSAPQVASGRTVADAIEEVQATFVDAVRVRLRSDVSVGILLSGGLDSSSIATAVHRILPEDADIRLISAVGDRSDPGEEHFIDSAAAPLRRPVHKVALDYSPDDAFDLLADACWFNDEPVPSFSTVAHYLLMQRARDLGVTVLLSGQGADETLCGYTKYVLFQMQALLKSGRVRAGVRMIGDFAQPGRLLSQFTYGEAKRYLPPWLHMPEIDVCGAVLQERTTRRRVGLGNRTVTERQIADIEEFSVPALVHYEDRMSMAASREIRLPFLDYRLVTLLLSLPADVKLRDGWTKWIFRKAMESWLPREITWRKDKQGFPVPQSRWLRTRLSDQIRQLLQGEWVTERLGLVNRTRVAARYEAYTHSLAGTRYAEKDMFAPIALEMWARRFEPYLM